MRAVVKFAIRVGSAANATTVLTAVSTRLASVPGATIIQALRTVAHPRGRLVTASLAVADEADAAALVTDLETLWNGAQAARALAGSRAWWTRNYDDEGRGVPDEPRDERRK